MRQLAFGLSTPPQPTLDNFVAGANTELVVRLRDFAAGTLAEPMIYLWGEAGSGRSHLLLAVGQRAPEIHTADDVQLLDQTGQIALFNAINRVRESGGKVLAAGDAPPAQLPLRADLKSRLGWGLVYQVKPLTDAERAVFLSGEAARRGMHLADEVIRYLLSHARRDLPSLMAILDEIDNVSLERQRHITLPLVREAVARKFTNT